MGVHGAEHAVGFDYSPLKERMGMPVVERLEAYSTVAADVLIRQGV
jgi:hypothetical protein